jgi:hypothetical protein
MDEQRAEARATNTAEKVKDTASDLARRVEIGIQDKLYQARTTFHMFRQGLGTQ